jgi:hypothetical protein
MNLCPSGFAGCYGRVAHPAGVHEAVARIREARPDAVTLNETCRRDVAEIARRRGYHLRFSTVTVAGDPLASRRADARTVIFGGDVNRSRGCAPRAPGPGPTPSPARPPGLQGVYGTGALHSPSAQAIPAAHTDHHAMLLVRAAVTFPARRLSGE